MMLQRPISRNINLLISELESSFPEILETFWGWIFFFFLSLGLKVVQVALYITTPTAVENDELRNRKFF